MAFKLLARTRENTSTVGTGPIALGGAVSSNNLTFGSQLSEGDTTFACALSSDGATWEEGFYTLTSGALARTAIIANSAGDTSPVALDGGRVFGIVPHDILFLLAKLLNPVDGQVIKYDGGLGHFVPASVGGVSWHQAVALATAAALAANTYSNGSSGVGATLTGNSNGALSVDGVAVIAGYRILVKDEAAGAHNGIYVVTAAGDGSHPYVLTRATDHDDAGDIGQADATVVGTAGSVNGSTIWISTIAFPFTLGTTSMAWSEIVAGGGGGSVALDDLTDVFISSPADGDVLTYSSGNFINLPPSGGGGLFADVLSAGPPTQSSTGLTTWVNQGTASVSDNAHGLRLTVPATIGDSVRMLKKTPPATPYTYSALISISAAFNNYQSTGIGFRNGTDKIHVMGMGYGDGARLISVNKYSNETTYSGSESVNTLWPSDKVFLQIENDGTDLHFRYSSLGDDWIQLLSIALASSYLGASGYTEFIFWANRNNNGGASPLISTLMWLDES